MSINSVDYTSSQSIGNAILQQLQANESSTDSSNGLSSLLGDLVSISSTGQQLSKAPDSVVKAMSDLFSGKTDVQSDITALQTYFQQNPDGLTNVLSTLQGGSSTYDSLGNLTSGSDNKALMAALIGVQSQSSLLNFLGDSGSGSSSSSFSLLG